MNYVQAVLLIISGTMLLCSIILFVYGFYLDYRVTCAIEAEESRTEVWNGLSEHANLLDSQSSASATYGMVGTHRNSYGSF